MATEGSAAMGESTDSSYVNVDAPPPDNVEGAPIAGNGWSKKRGYFVLPHGAHIEVLGERIWHHESGSYLHILAEGMWGTGSESARSEDWSSKS